MIRDRQPTTREIIDALRYSTAQIAWCVTPRGRAVPAEIYIEEIGTWLRADGSFAQFARNGERQFGRVAAARIRHAVRHWDKRNLSTHINNVVEEMAP